MNLSDIRVNEERVTANVIGSKEVFDLKVSLFESPFCVLGRIIVEKSGASQLSLYESSILINSLPGTGEARNVNLYFVDKSALLKFVDSYLLGLASSSKDIARVSDEGRLIVGLIENENIEIDLGELHGPMSRGYLQLGRYSFTSTLQDHALSMSHLKSSWPIPIAVSFEGQTREDFVRLTNIVLAGEMSR